MIVLRIVLPGALARVLTRGHHDSVRVWRGDAQVDAEVGGGGGYRLDPGESIVCEKHHKTGFWVDILGPVRQIRWCTTEAAEADGVRGRPAARRAAPDRGSRVRLRQTPARTGRT